MKSFIKTIGCLSLMFVVTAIAGCVSFAGDLPKSYHFDPSGPNGLVIYSVSCNMASGRGELDMRPTSNEMVDASINSRLYRINFNCNAPDENLSQPEVKMLDLPGGWYEIEGFQIFTISPMGQPLIVWPTNYSKMYIHVIPGKVMYFGRYQLASGYNLQFHIDHSNAIQEDLPVMQQHVPSLTIKDVNLQGLQ